MADAEAASLNADAQSASIDRAALDAAIRAQGAAFREAVTAAHAHLFAGVPVYATVAQIAQMKAVIAAVEAVVTLPGWLNAVSLPQRAPHLNPLPLAGEEMNVKSNLQSLGVFYGYDFHLNSEGAHLIEINTNAGGAFLCALLIASQYDLSKSGASPVHASTGPARTEIGLEQEFLEMFRNEWRLARGDAPLRTIAIIDEQPEAQYLYPEFLLARLLFERAGIVVHIADPSALQANPDGLHCNGQRIDLIYNRLTDFDLQRYPHIRSAWGQQKIVLTPNPGHYRRYADKRKLALLSDAGWLHAAGVSQAGIEALLRGVPQTRVVRAEDAGQWWAERKQWFFKPVSGYGSKGAYRGDKVTKRVFEEIMQADYVAQRLALPGERMVAVEGAEPQPLKYDVRCYVYDGKIQLIAARLYQGQTTNFRTPGGGFAVVRVVG